MALSKVPELHLWSTLGPAVLQRIKTKIKLLNQFSFVINYIILSMEMKTNE